MAPARDRVAIAGADFVREFQVLEVRPGYASIAFRFFEVAGVEPKSSHWSPTTAPCDLVSNVTALPID